MYEASKKDDWPGIGIVSRKFSLKTFHDELKDICGFFPDDTFDTIRIIACNPFQSTSIAESFDAHPMHTDASFSVEQLEKFVLHFKRLDENAGGVSTFIPVQWLLDKIPQKHKEILEQVKFTYARAGSKGNSKPAAAPILQWKSAIDYVFRWRLDDKVRPLAMDAHDIDIDNAINWVNQFLINTTPLMYRAQRDDTILIDNRRFLHGRTALSQSSSRIVWRAWIK